MTALDNVFSVFTKTQEWLTGSFENVSALFYVPETGLTFLGTCAVAGLSIGVGLLVVNVVKDFIRFH